MDKDGIGSESGWMRMELGLCLSLGESGGDAWYCDFIFHILYILYIIIINIILLLVHVWPFPL